MDECLPEIFLLACGFSKVDQTVWGLFVYSEEEALLSEEGRKVDDGAAEYNPEWRSGLLCRVAGPRAS